MSTPRIIPGSIAHLNAARAKLGVTPGNNVDPTSQFYDLSGNAHHGTLTNFAYEAGNRPRTNAEADKAKWHDLSGLGNDGTLTNFGFTTASGWATEPDRIVFDGDLDVVSLPSCTLGVSDLTLEAWASVDSAAGNYGAIFCLGDPNDAYSASILVSETGGFCRVRSYYRSPTRSATWTWAPLSDAVQHIIVTFDRDGYMVLTVDDVGIGQVNISAGAADSHPATTPGLGSRPGWYSKCGILVARRYSRVLSVEERAQNNAAGPTGTGYVHTGLVLDFNAARAVRASGWVDL